jgi:hypothetical protein
LQQLGECIEHERFPCPGDQITETRAPRPSALQLLAARHDLRDSPGSVLQNGVHLGECREELLVCHTRLLLPTTGEARVLE